MTEWQPIETAPKDGLFDIYVQHKTKSLGTRIPAVRYDEGGELWNFYKGDFVDTSQWEVTHWMPLPKPPETAND